MNKFAHAGAFAVIVAALLWSVDGLLRRNLYSLPPSVVVFYEHVLGVILLAPFLWSTRSKFRGLTRKQWWAMGLVALLSGALGTILYTAALGQVNFINFSVVVLLQQLNPIFAIATAAMLLREKLSAKFLSLAAVALIGAYLVSFPDLTVNLDTGKGTLIAALYAAGAAAAWGIGTAFSKYALKGTSYPHVTAARFGLTAVISLFFVLGSGSAAAVSQITQPQFFYLLAITFSTGLVALLIYYYGLQRVTASRAAVLELAWPLSAVLIGWAFLQQGLTLTQGVGAVILLICTYTLSMKNTVLEDSHSL
ncbi:DMT family transporter [Candidatus Saccharibacteria bacterium]|nr:MAG: DMT family transporter [Candidatus Saccharibacteria bacterium]